MELCLTCPTLLLLLVSMVQGDFMVEWNKKQAFAPEKKEVVKSSAILPAASAKGSKRQGPLPLWLAGQSVVRVGCMCVCEVLAQVSVTCFPHQFQPNNGIAKE
jgi:hypothetical protein